jgi:DNA repair protein RecO (recombination protein O)
VPTITDQAVVIRQWDFSETSQTVSLFTRGHGVIRGLAKGARREKGSFSGGMDVLTGGQIVAIVKPGRDLATLTAWHVQQMYPAVRTHLPANRAGLYMADLINHMIIDHDPHPAVFEAFTSALEGLANATQIDVALLRFQWTLLRECGYEPQVERDAQTGRELAANATTFVFSAAAAGFLAEASEASGIDESPLSDKRFSKKHDMDVLMDDRENTSHDRAQSTDNQVGPLRRPVPDAAGSWRVRAETVRVLQAVASGQPLADSTSTALGRANRLLAAYIRELLGSEPATMRWAFSDPKSKP